MHCHLSAIVEADRLSARKICGSSTDCTPSAFARAFACSYSHALISGSAWLAKGIRKYCPKSGSRNQTTLMSRGSRRNTNFRLALGVSGSVALIHERRTSA